MTMRHPLTLPTLLERARLYFPTREIVSRTGSGLFRYTYADYDRRVRRLASALKGLGVTRGTRVGTLAWNHHRHLEAYFAVPCMGAVLHTVNLRLPADHLAYVINHAGDNVLLVDPDLLPLVENVRDQLETVKHIIVLTDGDLPASGFPSVLGYEALLEAGDPDFRFPDDLDEWDEAGICYSSATTGLPKGVVYVHRAIYLHSLALCTADMAAVSERDTILPVVPMFHVNAWGLPFAATWMGARQVLPGVRPDPATICRLIESERVTLAAGVPTVWMGVLRELEQQPHDFSSITRLVCGGSAPPRALIEAYERMGVPFMHAYGMTEAAPLTHCSRVRRVEDETVEQRLSRLARQGVLAPGLEMRLVKEDGSEAAWDGREMGEVVLRGPWVTHEYYQDQRSQATFRDGWYYTGDVATADPEGYLQIVDRVKDLVKSGGEWISSVDLENAIMAHPKVAEAAVVACLHPKWSERPLACVVVKPEHRGTLDAQEIRSFLTGRFADWWLPDDVVFIDEVPKTGVGKFDKKVLRDRFWHHYSPKER